MKTCAVIPHFDHVDQFRRMLPGLVAQGLPIIIVDDASPEESFDNLRRLVAESAAEATLIRHKKNSGKGGAVMTGLKAALEAGYTHALQVDADGQHDVADIPGFRALAEEYPDGIICGQPIFDETISRMRYYARYLTLLFSWLESLSTEIRDALCGFRLYPLAPVVALFEKSRPGQRMAFDPEILVRATWAGIRLRYIPVTVHYPQEGKSHFHYLRDNAEISWMHVRLIAGMLIRLPLLIWRNRPRRQGHDTR